ncbi:MAG: glycosyltransferase family 4 protein [Bacteroidia bacterium]
MRILFALQLPPPVHGSSVVGKLIQEKFSRRSDIASSFVDIGISKNASDIGKFGLLKLWRIGVVIWTLLIRFLSFRPDRVYYAPTLTGFGFQKDFINVLLIKFLLKREGQIYLHLHNRGISELGEISSVKRRMYVYFFKSVKVILLSNHLYNDIKDFVSVDQIVVLPNGTKDLLPTAEKGFSKSGTQPMQIGYLSNLIISKGVLLLLDVLKELHKNDYKFNCTIAGNESELTHVTLDSEIKKRGLADVVHYIGSVQGERKTLFFKNLDVFVFPTKYPLECMPLVLIEAASCGLPLICSDLGGIPDIVDKSNGFLIEVNQLTEGVYNALCQLYDSPRLVYELGSNSRKVYEEKFTEEIFTRNIYDILTYP